MVSQPTAFVQPMVKAAALIDGASHPDNLAFIDRAQQFLGAVSPVDIRRQIPSAFRDCFDRVMFYERAEDDFRFLMFGAALSRLLALEATGLRFSHAFRGWPDFAQLATACACRVLDDGRVSGVVGAFLLGGVTIGFETATVPVFSDHGRPAFGFGHVALILPDAAGQTV